MAMKNKPRNINVILFFIGFVLLFVLAFTLGIIIGKGLGGSRYVERNVQEKLQATPEENTEVVSKEEEPGTRSAEEREPAEQEFHQKELSLPNKEITLKEESEATEDQSKKTVDKEAESVPEPVASSSESMNEELELRENPPDKNTQVTATKETQVAKIDKKTEVLPSSGKLPETDPGGKFTIQLGSFKSREMAFDLEKKMSSRGYPSFVRKVVIPDKGEWYRVRVGTFNDKKKAEFYGKILKSRESFLKDVYVTSNN